ncbi:LysM peptidoglycan-binding domain-containing protein [Promicromonospora sp. Marseille-Q5078]
MSGSIERHPRSGGPRTRPGGGLGRLAVLTLAAGLAGTALALRAASFAPRTATAAAGLGVDRWVELVVLAAGMVAAAWLVLSGALALGCVTASRLGGRWRAGEAAVERLAPAAVRRLVRSAVGVGVGAGIALAPTAALAADVSPAAPAADGASVVRALGWRPPSHAGPASATGGPADTADTADTADAVPDAEHAGAEADLVEETRTVAPDDDEPDDEPVAPAASPVARTAAGDDGTDDTRVVLRGDTLWAIATDALGGTPTDADVLREVTRWHDANRDVIGADPDHILPGQILRAPA